MSILILCAVAVRAEEVNVKYRGSVNLDPFHCADVARSSLIKRVCYQSAKSYLILGLNGVYYHWCGVPQSTVDAFMGAPSMGRYFNAEIKGKFICKEVGVPS
jgi:hypothetical protein